MKATKEELIDLLKECYECYLENQRISITLSKKIEKSIKSDEPDELRAIGKHEAKENICPYCHGSGYGIKKYKTPCLKCKGSGQI